MSRTRIAFFEVDGALTTATTIFGFLRHYLAAQSHARTCTTSGAGGSRP